MMRVLLMEEDWELGENISELLELSGYQVANTFSAVSGFELAKIGNLDIILDDIDTQKNQGRLFLDLIRKDEITCRIPRILISNGHALAKIKNDAFGGLELYLHKPFTIEELIEAIRLRLATPF